MYYDRPTYRWRRGQRPNGVPQGDGGGEQAGAGPKRVFLPREECDAAEGCAGGARGGGGGRARGRAGEDCEEAAEAAYRTLPKAGGGAVKGLCAEVMD